MGIAHLNVANLLISGQGMYRTAQWIKSRIHTREIGEVAVMSVYESKNDLTEEEAKASSSGGRNQILRLTMQRYWVRCVHTHTYTHVCLYAYTYP